MIPLDTLLLSVFATLILLDHEFYLTDGRISCWQYSECRLSRSNSLINPVAPSTRCHDIKLSLFITIQIMIGVENNNQNKNMQGHLQNSHKMSHC